MRLSRAIISLMAGFFVAQMLFYYPNLPAQLASHFNTAGEPTESMNKEGFVAFEFIVLLVIVAQFAFLPFLIGKVPESLINLPNKEFRLAEERRQETFAVMRNYFDWLGTALLGLLIAVNQMIFKANISQTNLPPAEMWLIISAFLFFTLGWMIKFVRHFKIT